MESTNPDNERSSRNEALEQNTFAPTISLSADMEEHGFIRSQQMFIRRGILQDDRTIGFTKDAAPLDQASLSEKNRVKTGPVRDSREEVSSFYPAKMSRPDMDPSKSFKAFPQTGFRLRKDSTEALETYQGSFRDQMPQESQHHRREKMTFCPSRNDEKEHLYTEKEHVARKAAAGDVQQREHSCSPEDVPCGRKELLLAVNMPSEIATEESDLRNSSKLQGWRYEMPRDSEAQKNGRNDCQKRGKHKRSYEDSILPPLSWEEKGSREARFQFVKRLRRDSDRVMPQDSAMWEVLKEEEAFCELVCGGQQEMIDRTDVVIVNPSLINDEYEEEEGASLESLGGVKMEHIWSPSREIEECTAQENQQDAATMSKAYESLCASGEDSGMEDGELEPGNEVRGSSEGMEEDVEHSSHRDEKGVSSHEKLEFHVNSKLGGGRNLEEENQKHTEFGRMMEVTDMVVEQMGEVESSDSMKGSMQPRPAIEARQDCKITAGDDDSSQKELVETHGTDITREPVNSGEMNSDGKTYDASLLHQNRKGEGYTGLALDLLVDRMMTSESKHENEELLDFHVKVENKLSIENDDSGKELTLSLSISLPAKDHQNKNGMKVDGCKEVLTMELQKQEDLPKVNNINTSLSEKRLNGSDSMKSTELSCEHKKLKVEPVHLSLSPPDSSKRLIRSCPSQGPDAPEFDKTVQSVGQTFTNSDGFTTSFSFSHSHPFSHNPSCSLSHASFDNQEFSCGSQQISQGNDQVFHGNKPIPLVNDKAAHGSCFNGRSQDRSKPWQEVSFHQRIIQNGSFQTHHNFHTHTGGNKSSSLNERPYEKVSGNQISQGGHHMSQTVNAGQKNRLEIGKPMHGYRPARSMGSQGTKTFSYSQLEKGGFVSERERYPPASRKAYVVKDEDVAGTKSLGNERIGLLEIVTEPVATMARKLQELPDSFLEGLKDMVKEMLVNIEKREEFISLQKIILKRTDLTQETLLRAHRTQLELLLAIKTGVQAFVHPDCQSLTYKALIEIFLQTRCRNFYCQFQLPVDGCECKICSQKSGFCNACMCTVCSKFDFEAKTCRWVGCDYCMHWCHTDCGLRMSYIVPGSSSISGGLETLGMQFRCIGCGHNSELFGFVKEVFTNFVNDWNAETLAKELDCVRRIFHGSADTRGKQLFWKAEEMLQKLENKFDIRQICRSMLRFFTEENVEVGANDSRPLGSKAPSNHAIENIWDAALRLNPSGGKKLPDLDRAQVLQTYNHELAEKKTEVADLQYNTALGKAEIDELERIVRIKLAEAKMFQSRADEARHEAEGLQRIAAAKSEKIDQDCTSKLMKLRLSEAEERRRKRIEELHILEKAQDDYKNLKLVMEVDIKDLLRRMEATKRQVF